jgi:hypothetical protein
MDLLLNLGEEYSVLYLPGGVVKGEERAVGDLARTPWMTSSKWVCNKSQTKSESLTCKNVNLFNLK